MEGEVQKMHYVGGGSFVLTVSGQRGVPISFGSSIEVIQGEVDRLVRLGSIISGMNQMGAMLDQIWNR
jgi:hypothetical protein